MVLARRENATDKRPERRKVIVLVRTRTVRRPVSVFARDGRMKDVTEWVCVRLKVNDDGAPSEMVGPGTFLCLRESVIRKMHRYVGFLGDLSGPVDWESF